MEFNRYEMKIFSLHIRFYVRFYNTGRINILFFNPPKALVSFVFLPLKKNKKNPKKLEKVHGHGRNS